jgi:hypothetical protein
MLKSRRQEEKSCRRLVCSKTYDYLCTAFEVVGAFIVTLLSKQTTTRSTPYKGKRAKPRSLTLWGFFIPAFVVVCLG